MILGSDSALSLGSDRTSVRGNGVTGGGLTARALAIGLHLFDATDASRLHRVAVGLQARKGVVSALWRGACGRSAAW